MDHNFLSIGSPMKNIYKINVSLFLLVWRKKSKKILVDEFSQKTHSEESRCFSNQNVLEVEYPLYRIYI